MAAVVLISLLLIRGSDSARKIHVSIHGLSIAWVSYTALWGTAHMIGHPGRCTFQGPRTMDGDNRHGRDISKEDVRGKVPWAKVKGKSQKGYGTY